jgi:hypothetical protein
MESGAKMFLGAGNHWMSTKDAIDEGQVIADCFDPKFEQQGLLHHPPCRGQSFASEDILLPSSNDQRIVAKMTHKCWHGRTEISQIAGQHVSMKSPAKYIFTGDRHHPGAGAERGKMFVLDCGKQRVIPYCDAIGKSPSVNGVMVAGYGANGEDILETTYILNPVLSRIVGWNSTAEILTRASSVIEEARKDKSLAREKSKIDFLVTKLGGKVDWK